MRICRFESEGEAGAAIGFYSETGILPLKAAAQWWQQRTSKPINLPDGDDLLALLPPDGPGFAAARELAGWLAEQTGELPAELRLPLDSVHLLVPVPQPKKLFLLAGNYARHIEEGGGIAAERAETFPYVFMKPPTTTLTAPGQAIQIPVVSPDHVDWELELAVIIGREGKGIREAEALQHVAGYTVLNDISDRRFRPNPHRKQRDRDQFFDWLHGKWHDSFCPCGPCIASADEIADPQNLEMKLRVNGRLHQDSNTAQQIFPVAAVIEFISSFVTLEPGDIISTGTPAGVGNTTGTYLKAGDAIEATIGSIGTLATTVAAE